MKQKLLKTLVLLCALIVGSATSWADSATINFGSADGSTSINAASITGDDSQGNKWTITTVGTTSFTPKASYAQVGSSKKPATSITFTTTLANDVNVTSFSAKFGGFSGTAGTVTLKVGDTTVGTGNLNASNDVTVTSSSAQTGKTLTVTVTDISKGVICYYISYTYTSGSSDSEPVTGVSLNPKELDLTVDSKATLTATVAPANASNKNVSWESSNTDVATVDNGEVTAIAAGTATITVTTEEGNHTATCYVTVREAKDYATLPFNWEGGVKDDFTSLEGVTASGLGKDYAVDNAPYRVKFDNTDDYIQIQTDSQIGNISIGVKMIGGASASSITVQESTDGETFTDVETLSISGNRNDVLSLETSSTFAAASRYVRFVFTKGSNVGVGPISIEKAVTISSVGYATLYTPAALDFSGVAGLTAYTAAKDNDVVRLTKVNDVQANTGVVLEGTAGTYSIPAIATSSTAKGELTGNATEATAWNAESGYTYYVLASTGSGVEFRPVNKGEIAAGKAFLKVAGNLVHAFNVVFGDETGISEVVRDGEKESAIFDLSGRRVAKPAKGLYIVNGKKILVK